MFRIKVGLTVAVAVAMAISMGAMASSALAVELNPEKCEGGTFINACWTEKESTTNLRELVGKAEFLGLPEEETVVFKSEIGGEKITIECKDVHADGFLIQNKPLTENASIEIPATTGLVFKECKLTAGVPKCEVKPEEPTVALTGTPQTTSDVIFKPKTGENFIEIEFKNKGSEKCPSTILGKHAVKGEQLCEFVNPEVDEETHLLNCETTGSKLKFGTENATATVLFMLGIELDELVGSDWWDIVSIS